MAAVLLPTCLTVIIGGNWWIRRYLGQAESSVNNRDWQSARQSLQTYLYFHPNDSAARLMMAEAYIRDNKLLGDDKVLSAIDHLSRIPDSAPRAAEARLQEGRLRLLLLLQPGRAERAFQASIRLDPERMESHSLLWRLYDLTNRWESAEPHVWKMCENLSEVERADRLRDWYLSEFSPGAANVNLERRLGLLGETEAPSNETDRRRLEAFITAEPDWIDGYALLARWLHRHGGLQEANRELDRACELPGGSQAPLVIATRVAVCLELGEFDRATQAFQQWPEPHTGYEYWKTAGLVADQVHRDNAQASNAFEKAIQTIAGKSDWLIQHRLAQCLARQGKTDLAANLRKHSKTVELLMETQVHSELRKALLTPLAPQTIIQMVGLYKELGRDREVSAWQQLTSATEKASLSPSESKSRQNVSNEDSNRQTPAVSKPQPDSNSPE